jgi:hypothetical protein
MVLGVVVADMTGDVGHVQINIDKFFRKTLYDVQISLISEVTGMDRRQVNFHDDLVNVVKIFDW